MNEELIPAESMTSFSSVFVWPKIVVEKEREKRRRPRMTIFVPAPLVRVSSN